MLAEVAAAHGVTSVIMGVTGSEQLEDNLSAAELDLSEAQMAPLNEVSALTPEYPGGMLNRSDGRAPSPARTTPTPTTVIPVPAPIR